MFKKQIIFIPGLFAVGMLVGIAIMNSRTSDDPVDDVMETRGAPVADDIPLTNPFVSTQAPAPDNKLQAMQDQLDRLSRRIDELERKSQTPTEPETEAETGDVVSALTPHTGINQPNISMRDILSAERLVKAGIDTERANDIIRRKNEIELKKLELRDRAIRENYLGTSRYNRELIELTAAETSLREELGDDGYDRYLFANRQNNRVLVSSVMLGSQAELAGIQQGDLILSYDDQRLFDWSELQHATTQGERGEYVNINVWRDGQLVNLWVPRGPLGVRLGATRREP